MLNISSRRLSTSGLSLIILIIVIVGTAGVTNLFSNSYTNQNTSNTKLLDNYLNTLQSSKYLPQPTIPASSAQNKLWIIHYTDSQTKTLLLDQLSHLHIHVLNIFQTLPFITANMTQEQVNYLQTLFPKTIQCTVNNEWQAFPKPANVTAITQGSSVPVGYQSPREIIQANSLGNTTLGQGVTIAIIDTGIDYTHPAFSNNLSRIVFNESFVNPSYGYSTTESILDQNGHGTHVAGIAAGDGSGIFMGVAPDANLVILKVGDFLGYITDAGVLAAIDVAIQHHVNVISMSLGSSSSNPNDPISLAVDDAVEQGISVTVAAGNDGPSIGSVGTPASSHLAITVGATQGNSTVTSFSSRGPTSDYRIKPDVVAPGYNIIAPLANGSLADLSSSYFEPSMAINTNYIAFSGTSMATPVVAGAVALLKQLHPNLTPMAIRSALMSSATSLGLPPNVQGAGLVNVFRANEFLTNNMTSPTDSIAHTLSVLPGQNILSNFYVPTTIFPNDNFSMRLFIVSGANVSVSVYVPNATFSQVFIPTIEDSYGFTSTMGYYKEILLSVAPGPTPTFGYYYGSLQINITGGPNVNMSINVGSFEVTSPRESILWPLFHTASSTSPNTLTSNFYNFSNYLRTKDISIATTDGYLSSNLLTSYDAVIIVSPLTPFIPSEIQALQQYVASGGHVMILGTYSAFFDYTNLNTFLSPYGVQFLGNSPISIQDMGVSQNILSPEPSNLSLNYGSPLLTNVKNLNWYSGSFLNISGKTTIPLATVSAYTTSPVGLAYFAGNGAGAGSIFISGEQDLFTNQNFLSPGDNSDVALFVDNLVSNFFNYSSARLTVFPTPTAISQKTNLTFGATFWNTTTFKHTITATNANMTVTITNLAINTTTSINETFNTTLDYFVVVLLNNNFTSPGLYQLNFSYDKYSVERIIQVYSAEVSWNLGMQISGTINPNQLPNYLTSADIGSTVMLGQAITFALNSTSTLLNHPLLMISNAPLLFYGMNSFYQNVSSIVNIVLTDSYKSSTSGSPTIWSFPGYTFNVSLPTGIYYVEAYQNISSTETLSPTSSFDGFFYVIDTQPSINLITSMVDGSNSLSTYQIASNPQNTLILQPALGSNVSLSIIASSMGHTSQLRVVVILAPYYPFLDYNLELSVEDLSMVNATSFAGNIQMPTLTLYSLVGAPYNLTISNQLLVMYIMLYDQYGNYDAFPVFLVLGQNSTSDNLTPFIIVGLLFLGTFFFYLIYRSSRKRRSQDIYYQYPPRQPSNQYGQPSNQYGQPPPSQQPPSLVPKYCPHCGSPMVPGANFCMECGRKLT